MAKIFIPAVNEYREITQIVAFGCSMTQGAELCDQERWGSFLDSDVEEFKRKIGMKEFSNWAVKHDLLGTTADNKIIDKERQIAWVAQVAKLYDIPCYNFAEGGSSFEKQITQFVLANDHGYITDTTLVLWGFTTKERGVWFQDDRFQGYLLNGSIKPDGKFTTPDVEQFFLNRVNSDSMLLWKYLMCMQSAFDFAHTVCNDQFMFVQALMAHWDYDDMPPWEQKVFTQDKFVRVVRAYANILRPKHQKYRIFNNLDAHKFNDWAISLPDGRLAGCHPTLETHQKYAQMIVETLDNKAKLRYNTYID
jgi:hypothetical protein